MEGQDAARLLIQQDSEGIYLLVGIVLSFQHFDKVTGGLWTPRSEPGAVDGGNSRVDLDPLIYTGRVSAE